MSSKRRHSGTLNDNTIDLLDLENSNRQPQKRQRLDPVDTQLQGNPLQKLKAVIGGAFGFTASKNDDTSLGSAGDENVSLAQTGANNTFDPKTTFLDDAISSRMDDTIDASTVRITRHFDDTVDELAEPYLLNETAPSASPSTPKRKVTSPTITRKNITRTSGNRLFEISAEYEPQRRSSTKSISQNESSVGDEASFVTDPAMSLSGDDELVGETSRHSGTNLFPGVSSTSTDSAPMSAKPMKVDVVIRQERKSILTPSKNKSARPGKSVAFQVGVVPDLDLGFKDLPSHREFDELDMEPDELQDHISPPLLQKKDQTGNRTTKDSPATKANLHSADMLSENESNAQIEISELDQIIDEDINCSICQQGHSEPPNEILICDGCEVAVHQQCYDIPTIPSGDWFCNDCNGTNIGNEGSANDIRTGPELFPVVVDKRFQPPDPNIENLDYNMRLTQRLIMEKVTGRQRLKLCGLQNEYSNVRQIVEQTVSAGEGNSMLVIGSRGSGKTTLVEAVLKDIAASRRQHFYVIRLNGLIHTDDKTAIREIWRQLGRELSVDEYVTARTNSASDTLASLLALLSHPEELSEENVDRTANSVVFVLDEFDRFTSHPRQTLLYNLFDIAQARKAPIAVLGLTTKIDVVESLEKRVKSRFSHRYTHLPLPKSYVSFWEICKSALCIDLDDVVEYGFDPGMAGLEDFLEYWDKMLEELQVKDLHFKQHLLSHYYRSKSVSSFLASCILPIANLTTPSLPLIGANFYIASTAPPDSKLAMLPNLAELDLAMLIAAARLDVVLDTDVCNFSMAYDEYSELTSKHRIQASSSGVLAMGSSTKVWAREVATGSWQRLCEYELLMPAMAGAGGSWEGRMYKVDVSLMEIRQSVEGLSSIFARWCREI